MIDNHSFYEIPLYLDNYTHANRYTHANDK